LTYQWTIANPLGSNAVLNSPASPTPSFTPDIEGNYVCQLTVSNGTMLSYDSVTTTVISNYDPYLILPIGDKTINENEILQFTVSANDPDGDTLTYSIEQVTGYSFPLGASMEPASGTFSWKPRFNDQGAYKVRIKVIDTRGGEDHEDINITVFDAPAIEVGGPNPDYNTIGEAMASASSGDAIFVYLGVYTEDLYMKDGVELLGDSPYTTEIHGRVFFVETNATVENLKIYFSGSSQIDLPSDYYGSSTLIADAGITAVNSEITIQSCIIESAVASQGKGIQIWNMHGTGSIAPQINNNLIINCDTAIYLFSQTSGGAINGSIANNTMDLNNYGLTLRMHSENPVIQDNIITSSVNDAIHITYEDGELLNNRRANIIGNDFYGNTRGIYCDSLQSEVAPIGIGNIYVNPQYTDPQTLDYTPLNSLCAGKGSVLK